MSEEDRHDHLPGPKLINQTLTIDTSLSGSADDEQPDNLLSIQPTTATTTANPSSHRYIHGRRYHNFSSDAYYLPNDSTEASRLDIQHHVWRLSLSGALYVSPLSTVHHVVDIGTGTGQWAIEFAQEHPEAIKVLGTDLSAIQPSTALPPNVEFAIANAEEPWTIGEKGRFDFVHSRMLMMGIHDWPRYFSQTWEALRPGGWMEVHEVQFPVCFQNPEAGSPVPAVTPLSPLLVWSQHVHTAAAKAGINTMIAPQFPSLLEAQGFVNVRSEQVKWPVGPWAVGNIEKETGRLTLQNTMQFVEAIAYRLFTKWLGWDKDRVGPFIEEVKQDLKEGGRCYYWQMYIFSAQKPEATAAPDCWSQEYGESLRTQPSSINFAG